MARPHVLLVTFPAPGHINPSLTFAKTLNRNGIEVTFVTSLYAQRRHIVEGSVDITNGITFVAFSDGYDDGFKLSGDKQKHMMEIRNRGSEALRNTILASAEQGHPVTCLVYSVLLPWAAVVAREVHIPSALLWIQPATVMDIYYYYFNGYSEEISNNSEDPSWVIQLPRLPLLAKRDLPSIILPSGGGGWNSSALLLFKEHIEILDAETKPKVLMNTFDALEPDALKAIEDYELIGIGPLIPSAFLDGKDPLDKGVGGDLFHKSEDYLQWLNSKPESSVVYVSFGSLLRLPKVQLEEIAKGLLECGRPFLWVTLVNENQEGEKDDDKLSCLEELEKLGKLVPWCSQLEVLTHPSLGCFVTHCGWNSTLESLACGVPMVAFPQWTDQRTNAKLIQDGWRTGLRVNTREDGIIESDEIKRCIRTIMDDGEKSREFRENARKWKNSAREAMQEDGSSTKNLKAFVEELGDC